MQHTCYTFSVRGAVSDQPRAAPPRRGREHDRVFLAVVVVVGVAAHAVVRADAPHAVARAGPAHPAHVACAAAARPVAEARAAAAARPHRGRHRRQAPAAHQDASQNSVRTR